MQMVQRYAYLDMENAHAQADDVFKDFFTHTFHTTEDKKLHT